MARKPKYEVLYCITEEDVFNVAEELGISKEKITLEVMQKVKEALEEGMNDWNYIIDSKLCEILNIEKSEE